jgi:hypothetical protein
MDLFENDLVDKKHPYFLETPYENKINNPLLVNSRNEQFIGIWEDIFFEDYCNYLITCFEKTDFLKYGMNGRRRDSHVTYNQLDLKCLSERVNNHLMSGISNCLNRYMEWYPYLQTLIYFSVNNLLQKTEPLEGYHAFHCEKDSSKNDKRCLTWMVYLNDVNEGGETEWLYQQLKIKPKRGTVVIWPTGFTHLHRGNPPMSNKYIVTGWFSSNYDGDEMKLYRYEDSKNALKFT